MAGAILLMLLCGFFPIEGATYIFHEDSRRIFGELVANYDSNSPNQRTLCKNGEICPEQEKPVKLEEKFCESKDDCPENEGEIVEKDVDNNHRDKNKIDVHKYQRKHQKKYLFPKDIDDELSKVKIPKTWRKIKRSMKKCGQEMSKKNITGEKANSVAPTAEKHESIRQNVRTMEDQQRMRTRLDTWPENKPRAAVYFPVQPVSNRVEMLKGEEGVYSCLCSI